jgi:hypothetical protein
MSRAYFQISPEIMTELLRLPEGVKFLGLRKVAEQPYTVQAVIEGDDLEEGAELQPIYETLYRGYGDPAPYDYRLKEMRRVA